MLYNISSLEKSISCFFSKVINNKSNNRENKVKKLSERINFSTEKPQNGENYLVFKVDKYLMVAMHDTFCLFCEGLRINLAEVDDDDFETCVKLFSIYYNSRKQRIKIDNLDSVTCYFWVDEK